MKKKMGFIETVLDGCTQNEASLIIGGVLHLKIESKKLLSRSDIHEAMYKTISKHPQLASTIVGNYFITQGDSLTTVKPNYSIKFIQKEFNLDKIQELLSDSTNEILHRIKNPWTLKIYVISKRITNENDLNSSTCTKEKENENNGTCTKENDSIRTIEKENTANENVQSGKPRFISTIYLQMSILNCLTDGIGLQIIGRTFADSLRVVLFQNYTSIPMSTKLLPFPKNVETSVSIFNIPIGFTTTPLFFIFVFYRLIVGSILCFYQLSFLKKYASSSPETQKNEHSQHRMTGIRIVNVNNQILEKLKINARRTNSTITSVLATSAFIADAAVAQKYNLENVNVTQNDFNLENFNRQPKINGNDINQQTGLIAYNFRKSTWDFIEDPETADSFVGSCTFPVPVLNYKLHDRDQYWTRCSKLKKIINFMTNSCGGPMLYLMSVLFTSITLYITSKQTTHEKRELSFLLTNNGQFKAEDLEFGPSTKLLSSFSSINSYWKSNKTRWQITASTINNKMNIVIAYPSYITCEADVNQFISAFTKSLKMAAENDDLVIGFVKEKLTQQKKFETAASKKILKSLPLL